MRPHTSGWGMWRRRDPGGTLGAHTRAPANALSSASRARPLASGTRCPYRSTVVVMDVWPGHQATIPENARYGVRLEPGPRWL